MGKQKRIEDLLKDVYAERLSRNPRYSKRAFARHLGVSPTTIQNILNRTNQPKLSTLRRLVSVLTQDKKSVDSIVHHHMERMRSVSESSDGFLASNSEQNDNYHFAFSLRSAELPIMIQQVEKILASLNSRVGGESRPILLTVKLC